MTIDPLIKQIRTRKRKKSKTNTSARTYNDSRSGTELKLRKSMANHKRLLVDKLQRREEEKREEEKSQKFSKFP